MIHVFFPLFFEGIGIYLRKAQFNQWCIRFMVLFALS